MTDSFEGVTCVTKEEVNQEVQEGRGCCYWIMQRLRRQPMAAYTETTPVDNWPNQDLTAVDVPTPVPVVHHSLPDESTSHEQEMYTRQRSRSYSQPRMPHQPEIDLAAELTKAELERDQFKKEIEDKERQIQEYEQQLIKYRTQNTMSNPHQQQQQSVVPDHSAVVQLEEKEKDIVELNRLIAEHEARIAQLEREKEKVEMNAAVEVSEIREEVEKLKLSLTEKEDALEKVTATIQSKVKEREAVFRQRLRKKEEEHETVKGQLERELLEAKKTAELVKGSTDQERNTTQELRGKLDKLEKEREEEKERVKLQTAKVTHLTEQLRKQENATGEACGKTGTERREKERLQREVEDLRNQVQMLNAESAQAAIQATQRIDQHEREIEQQLEAVKVTSGQYKQQLSEADRRPDLEEKVQRLQQLLAEQERTHREEIATLQWKVQQQQSVATDDGARAFPNSSLSDELRSAHELIEEKETALREKETLPEESGTLQDKYRNLMTHYTKLKLRVQEREEELEKAKRVSTELSQKLQEMNHENQLLLQRRDALQNELKRVRSEKVKEIDRLKTDYGMMIDKLGQKEGQLQETKKQLEGELQETREELDTQTALAVTLKESLDEKSKAVWELKEQLEEQMKSSQQRIDELKESLQVKEAQNAIFEDDFKKERKDREKIHQTLSAEVDKVTKECETIKELLTEEQKKSQSLEEKLNDKKQQKKKKLEKENDSLNEVIQQMADKAKTAEEEIQILTAQVNAYSRKGDELKRASTQSQERYKTLETEASELKSALTESQRKYKALESDQKTVETEARDLKRALAQSQERYKTLETGKKTSEEQLGNQLTILRQRLESVSTNKGQLLTAFNKEQERVASLEQEISQLRQQIDRMRNANKTLMEKVNASKHKSAEATPTTSKLATRTNSTGPPSYGIQATAQSTRGEEQVVIARSKGSSIYPPPNPEPSDSVPEEDPQMSKEEISRLFKHNQEPLMEQQQRQLLEEQQRQRFEQQERQAMEEQERQRVRQKADDALRELDYAREHGVQASTATTDPVNQANFVSGQGEEKSHDDDTDSDNEVWPENKLIEGIDQEIQYYADQVRQMSRRPDTAEVELSDEDDSLPYDPNLVCPKCGKRYRIGGVQKFRRHVKELCTASS